MRSSIENPRDLLTRCRKCLLLLNPLHPIADLLSPKPATASEILLHLIDLASAISDDLFCLSKLGLVSRRLGKKADLWSKWVCSFPPLYPSPPPHPAFILRPPPLSVRQIAWRGRLPECHIFHQSASKLLTRNEWLY
jgi:hypothetical protein